MKLIKITNLVNNLFKKCDYKGLDIDLFIQGSQVYNMEGDTVCLGTNEEFIPDNPDVAIITEQDYIDFRDAVEKLVVTVKDSINILERLELVQKAFDEILMGGN